MRRSKTTWRDLVGQIYKIETGSKAGNINLKGSAIILVFLGLIIVPTVLDIGKQVVFALLDKPGEGLPSSVITAIVLGSFMYIIICPVVIMYMESRNNK